MDEDYIGHFFLNICTLLVLLIIVVVVVVPISDWILLVEMSKQYPYLLGLREREIRAKIPTTVSSCVRKKGQLPDCV